MPVPAPAEKAVTASGGRRGALVSPVRWAAVVVVLLGVFIAVDVLILAADGRYLRVLGELAAEKGDFDGSALESFGAEFAAAEEDYSFYGNLSSQLLPVVAVAFLFWFFRTRINGEVFAPDGHRRGRLWTVGAWVTPIVNLWFPRQLAGDIWKASSPPGSRVSYVVVNAWWGMWVATNLLGVVGSSQMRGADGFGELRAAVRTLFLSDLLDAAAAVLAIVFVWRLTALQHVRINTPTPLPEPA
ncbi:DUF4328 domain-containing protein [Streptomyces sp. NPDC053560]|uniref:DUF4328 domain-containing protein n=1 Tax=Streptomyces sp. NPDC053560 TaxID=3365711 RepID=UPI0037D1BF67